MYLAGESHGTDEGGRHARDEAFLLILHSGDSDIGFVLPGAPFGHGYRTVVDTASGQSREAADVLPEGSTLTVRARSLVVLHALRRD